MVAAVRQALGGSLPACVASMRLYLPHPATRAILFKPIKSNIAEAHGQVGWGPVAGGPGALASVRRVGGQCSARVRRTRLSSRAVGHRASVPLRWNASPSARRTTLRCAAFLPPLQQIAALMDSEYTEEEVAAIGLTPPQELAALLDGLS